MIFTRKCQRVSLPNWSVGLRLGLSLGRQHRDRTSRRTPWVYFVKQLQVRDSDDDAADTRIVPMLREYTVFNVDQCDGLPDSIRGGKPMRVRNPDARDALADQFLRSTGADIREGTRARSRGGLSTWGGGCPCTYTTRSSA